jgi:hypothetical protein
MGDTRKMTAWNNMVMNAEPKLYELGDERRDAAITCLYMGGANNGGLNAFLTNCSVLDGQDVLQSLQEIGATAAADQFREVLKSLGGHLPAATQEVRRGQLENLWTDELDDGDFLTVEADRSMVTALEAHVSKHIEYYLSIPSQV